MQKLFWKACSKTRDMLKVQLDYFVICGMFGPPDPELRAAKETLDRLAALDREAVAGPRRVGALGKAARGRA